MLRPKGYATVVDPEGPLFERDTASCCHCSAAIFVKPRTVSTIYLILDPETRLWHEEPGASCWHCQKPICLLCWAKGICTPLEKMLEGLEARRS